MSRNVVHRDKRLVRSHSKTLCKACSHKQRPDKPGGIGHSDAVKVGHGAASLVKGFSNHPQNIFSVSPRSDLGHNSAEFLVLLHL